MSGRVLCLVCTAAVAAQIVLAPGAAGDVPQPPEPGTRSVADLLTDLQRRYGEVERATESYHATERKLTEQRAEVGRLDRALARARLSLHDSRRAAGKLARQQYQSSTDISPYVRLLLAHDPQHALEQGHVIGQLAQERAETVGRLAGNEKRAAALARAARRALDEQLTLTERREKQREDLRKRLHDIEGLLASLGTQQLAALGEFEKNGRTTGPGSDQAPATEAR